MLGPRRRRTPLPPAPARAECPPGPATSEQVQNNSKSRSHGLLGPRPEDVQ